MAKYLCANIDLVRGNNVVELGAGCGLPGILSARLGASRVLMTDFDDGTAHCLLRAHIFLQRFCLCYAKMLHKIHLLHQWLYKIWIGRNLFLPLTGLHIN